MRTRIPLIALLAGLTLVLTPALAPASTTDTIVRDCQHSQTGYLTGAYTKAQLRKALNNLPGDAAEYTGCYDQIKQALRDAELDGGSGQNGAGGGGGTQSGLVGGADGGGIGQTPSGGGGGSAAPQHVGTRAPVALAGVSVQPGTIPELGRNAHTLPTPLLVLLVLLGVGTLAPVVATIGRRVLARRRG